MAVREGADHPRQETALRQPARRGRATEDRAESASERQTRRSLADLADPSALKHVWRTKVRPAVSSRNLKTFYLATSPSDFLDFDWHLAAQVEHLCAELRRGTYRAQPVEYIRSAKTRGLTRPQAYLSPRDALVYVALVSLARVDLLRIGYPDWTGWGQADPTSKPDDDNDEESGWFRAWLKRQKKLWLVTESYPFIVETDIANFFPSVPIESLVDHVIENSKLDDTLTRLLAQVLRSFHHLPEYRNSTVVGLPQEPMDASRVLAHSYLVAVDKDFLPEGANNGYTRWMDDVVIGASSEADGHGKVARVQLCLEKLGLYPNTAKTRIVSASTLQRDLRKGVNDYLGEVDKQIRQRAAVDIARFQAALRQHLSEHDQSTSWQRVLKRFYTYSRDLNDPTLRHHARKHATAFPSLTGGILDYLLNWPIRVASIPRLFAIDGAVGGLYPSVRLLVYEFLMRAYNNDNASLRSAIADQALALTRRLLEEAPRIREATAASLLCAKFATEAHWDELLSLRTPGSKDDLFLRQLLVLRLASGRTDAAGARRELGRFADDSFCSFIEAVLDQNPRACLSILDRAGPAPADVPRPIIRPQPMFLAAVVRRVAPEQWHRRKGSWERRVSLRQPNRRDRAAERWLLGLDARP